MNKNNSPDCHPEIGNRFNTRDPSSCEAGLGMTRGVTNIIQVIHHIKDWQQIRKTFPIHTKLGFVPTMGQLHHGHFSLCQKSQAENDVTVVSIFVNPTQFSQHADYLHYPRSLEADLNHLQTYSIPYCFIPDAQEIYPDGYTYRIHTPHILETLEDHYRPGYFEGMLTIVMKLFQIIQPTQAYFGEKDYEQYLLVKNMIKDFFLDIHVCLCPTIRESNFLAYSSRHARLSAQDKIKAEQFATIFHQPKPLMVIRSELETLGIQIEYLEERQQRRYAAVYIAGVRLIDNYKVNTVESI